MSAEGMNTKTAWNIITFMVTLGLLLAIMVSVPTWLLWNWLMPSIFGLPEISLLEAFGLLILSGLLFKQTPGFQGLMQNRGEQ